MSIGGLGGRSAMMLNRADECRQRANECRREAAQVADHVLRVTYLDLARRWRMMAHQAESLERKELGSKTTLRVKAVSAFSRYQTSIGALGRAWTKLVSASGHSRTLKHNHHVRFTSESGRG